MSFFVKGSGRWWRTLSLSLISMTNVSTARWRANSSPARVIIIRLSINDDALSPCLVGKVIVAWAQARQEVVYLSWRNGDRCSFISLLLHCKMLYTVKILQKTININTGLEWRFLWDWLQNALNQLDISCWVFFTIWAILFIVDPVWTSFVWVITYRATS